MCCSKIVSSHVSRPFPDVQHADKYSNQQKIKFHMGQYHPTGHVAIMKEVVNCSIGTVAEQNGHRNIRIHPGIGWMRIDFP